MSESQSHKQTKSKAAGKKGQTEVSIPGNRRLDAYNPVTKTATEVERSGDPKLLCKAAARLNASKADKKVMKVPQSDMDKDVQAMRQSKVGGTVSNLTGSQTTKVKQ